jgi:hypothetical protein
MSNDTTWFSLNVLSVQKPMIPQTQQWAHDELLNMARKSPAAAAMVLEACADKMDAFRTANKRVSSIAGVLNATSW